MIQSRRGFLVGATATLFAAPAIVRAGSLMPVKVVQFNAYRHVYLGYEITRKAINDSLYGSFIVPPALVAHLGGGNIQNGHAILAKWIATSVTRQPQYWKREA